MNSYPFKGTRKHKSLTKVNSGSINKKVESTCSGRFKKSKTPRKGGSILSLMEEVVKEGEIVMMGDFNEVRHKADRFGSKFNAHDAEIFNSFIYNAGLDEVPLGGSAYTWCHKSTSKMTKLDKFLVSENLLNSCPNINAITLDRHISDHRPIIFRESMFDYGPIRLNLKAEISKLKEELQGFDMEIDKGNGSEELVHKRLEVLNKNQQISNIQTSEVAQKAKITWAVKGDENTKFFHGMLNKKRDQSNIRVVMVNGLWIDNPVQ
nr:RNA-directed DNA polymerase, eukaryota [Tanacetum cinerariifolium]